MEIPFKSWPEDDRAKFIDAVTRLCDELLAEHPGVYDSRIQEIIDAIEDELSGPTDDQAEAKKAD